MRRTILHVLVTVVLIAANTTAIAFPVTGCTCATDAGDWYEDTMMHSCCDVCVVEGVRSSDTTDNESCRYKSPCTGKQSEPAVFAEIPANHKTFDEKHRQPVFKTKYSSHEYSNIFSVTTALVTSSPDTDGPPEPLSLVLKTSVVYRI